MAASQGAQQLWPQPLSQQEQVAVAAAGVRTGEAARAAVSNRVLNMDDSLVERLERGVRGLTAPPQIRQTLNWARVGAASSPVAPRTTETTSDS